MWDALTRRWRLAVVVAFIAVTAMMLGGHLRTGASFTDSAVLGGQSVATATVDVEVAASTTTGILAAPNMLPGDQAEAVVDIVNSGSADVYLTVTLVLDDVQDQALSDSLLARVTVQGDTYEAPLSEWESGVLQVGVPLLAAAETPAAIQLTLPSGSDDSLQGLSAGFSFRVDAIQAKNTPVPQAGWIDN